MTFGEKLRAARKEKKLTQKELAQKIDAAHNSISNWENDQNSPDPETIQHLCWALEVQPNYFFMDDSVIPQADNIIPMPKMNKVPLLGTIACGTPILAVENIEEEIDIPEHIHADFALRCKGDSMIGADIRDGDIVYIKQQAEVLDGQIAAVLVEEEATLKRFYYDREAGIVTLVSENPSIPPRVYQGETLNHIRVLGRAVGFTRAI